MPTVGLFGTCGRSRWREPFIATFERAGIPFYNPQIAPEAWTPDCIPEEHRHLVEDEIIVWPVTDETPGSGSLAEVGYSILEAVRSNRLRHVIVMIDDECRDPDATPAMLDDSKRARKLAKTRVAEEARTRHNVHLVEDLEDALALVLKLWPAVTMLDDIKRSMAGRGHLKASTRPSPDISQLETA